MIIPIIVDIIASVLTLIALFMIPKNYKWWMTYAICALLFLYVRISYGLIGSCLLEVVALFIGVRNYRKLKPSKIRCRFLQANHQDTQRYR